MASPGVSRPGGVFLWGKVFVLLLAALLTIPPTDITIPWETLIALYALTLAGMAASTLWVNRRLNRPSTTLSSP